MLVLTWFLSISATGAIRIEGVLIYLDQVLYLRGLLAEPLSNLNNALLKVTVLSNRIK